MRGCGISVVLAACVLFATCPGIANASYLRTDRGVLAVHEAVPGPGHQDRKLLQSGGGYCTWGACDGKVTGGDWCNASPGNCEKCDLNWCYPEPVIPEHYGFCSWSACDKMFPVQEKWCQKSPENCGKCALTWCPTNGHCTFAKTCNGEPKGGTWCNAGESRCGGCGGNWCVVEEPIPEFFGWDATLPNVVKAYLDRAT